MSERGTGQFQEVAERVLSPSTRALTARGGASVLIDPEALAANTPLEWGEFVPLLPELLREPAEIWGSFFRNTLTGKVTLKRNFVKLVQTSTHGIIGLVAHVTDGVLEAWTVVWDADAETLNVYRTGKLIWARSQT